MPKSIKKDLAGTVFITILILLICNAYKKNRTYNMIVVEPKGKYLHFSIDDTRECITRLQKYNSESIFEDPTLSILKEWHDKYGIVASLYVQGDFTINSKYAAELITNSNWLKFGYHGTTESDIKTDMERFYRQVMDSIGSEDIIDKCPRIHYFHASHSTCMNLKDLGCIGFLTCDDWSWNSKKRESNYYLTNSQNIILDKNDRLYDTDNNIYFIKTDFRLEHIVQRWGTVINLLEYYSTNNAENNEMVIFSHEWCFNKFKSEADSIYYWATKNGYAFDYPANRLATNNNNKFLE